MNENSEDEVLAWHGRCPNCGYSLHDRPYSRCSECGLSLAKVVTTAQKDLGRPRRYALMAVLSAVTIVSMLSGSIAAGWFAVGLASSDVIVCFVAIYLIVFLACTTIAARKTITALSAVMGAFPISIRGIIAVLECCPAYSKYIRLLRVLPFAYGLFITLLPYSHRIVAWYGFSLQAWTNIMAIMTIPVVAYFGLDTGLFVGLFVATLRYRVSKGSAGHP